jgi:hypothetical protein
MQVPERAVKPRLVREWASPKMLRRLKMSQRPTMMQTHTLPKYTFQSKSQFHFL